MGPPLTVIAATGQVITKAAIGSPADVDVAVKAARAAFKTTWGLNCPGSKRGELLNKLADLIVKNIDEIAAIEALDSGAYGF
jgi:aldehyde dehydrogenase (NAD+)